MKTEFSRQFSQRPAYSFACEADADCPMYNVQSYPFLIHVAVPVPPIYNYYTHSVCLSFRSQLYCPVQATYLLLLWGDRSKDPPNKKRHVFLPPTYLPFNYCRLNKKKTKHKRRWSLIIHFVLRKLVNLHWDDQLNWTMQGALSGVRTVVIINPSNAELNRICHLLALLGAHHIFYISGLRVK